MKINGQLTASDYLKAQYLHARPSRAMAIAFGILVGLLALGFLAGFYIMLVDNNLSSLWGFSWPIALIIVVFLLYFFVMLPMRVRRIYGQHKEMSSPFEHEITPEGLVSSNLYGYAKRPWANFIKWKENQDLFMLYVSDVQFILIPRRFIAPEQLAALHARLQENNVTERGKPNRGGFIAMSIYFAVLIIIVAVVYWSYVSRVP